jgi:hypothetical protein
MRGGLSRAKVGSGRRGKSRDMVLRLYLHQFIIPHYDHACDYYQLFAQDLAEVLNLKSHACTQLISEIISATYIL